MTQLIPFTFSGQQVRVVEIDGEPFFVGNDLAATLGYANPRDAFSKHCKGVAKRYPIETAGGIQEVRVLSEADMLRLIVSSNLPSAEKFERWVFEDVLPAIRKTGGYQILAPQPSKLDVEIAGAEAFARMLKPAPSSQVAMLAQIVKNNGGDPAFLPAYVVDADTDSAVVSSMATKPLTDLLKSNGIRMSASAYNRQLAAAGFLVESTRKSTSPRAAGVKRFWTITEAGLRYGKNITSPNSPRETQPHWYVDRFPEMHQLVEKAAA